MQGEPEFQISLPCVPPIGGELSLRPWDDTNDLIHVEITRFEAQLVQRDHGTDEFDAHEAPILYAKLADYENEGAFSKFSQKLELSA